MTYLDPPCLHHCIRLPEVQELAAVADDQAAAIGSDAPPLPRLGPARIHSIHSIVWFDRSI